MNEKLISRKIKLVHSSLIKAETKKWLQGNFVFYNAHSPSELTSRIIEEWVQTKIKEKVEKNVR